MKIVGIIPCRYGAVRFPGKSLADIHGRPMMWYVYQQAKKANSLDEVFIATDDERISSACKRHDLPWIMTRSDHPTGTDRLVECIQTVSADIYVNVQGDEPLISPELIDELAMLMTANPGVPMATAAAPIEDVTQLNDPNVVKVVLSAERNALYFSRSLIPYPRNTDTGVTHYRHLGIYAFQRKFLFDFVKLPPSLLEKTESLEQLRAVEQGVRIRVVITNELSPGVDTLEQAIAIEEQLRGS